MKTKSLLLAALLCAGCATEKVSASEALGPVLTVHTLPEGGEVLQNGRSLGKAPVDVPIKRGDAAANLEAHKDGFLPSKVTIDLEGPRKNGGGEVWIALKVQSMGTDTPDLDAMKAADLDKGGIALKKAKRCPEADQFFRRALAVDPSFVKAHRDRSRCLASLKQYDAAATELELFLNNAELADDERKKVTDDIAKLRGQRDIDVGDGAPAARR